MAEFTSDLIGRMPTVGGSRDGGIHWVHTDNRDPPHDMCLTDEPRYQRTLLGERRGEPKLSAPVN
jgi:hypothetical protein